MLLSRQRNTILIPAVPSSFAGVATITTPLQATGLALARNQLWILHSAYSLTTFVPAVPADWTFQSATMQLFVVGGATIGQLPALPGGATALAIGLGLTWQPYEWRSNDWIDVLGAPQRPLEVALLSTLNNSGVASSITSPQIAVDLEVEQFDNPNLA